MPWWKSSVFLNPSQVFVLSRSQNKNSWEEPGKAEVACRSGSCSVVLELLRHQNRPALDRADVAGWTPLHVAARMSRCSLVVLLLKARPQQEGDASN